MTRRADFRSLGEGYVRAGEAPPKVLIVDTAATVLTGGQNCSLALAGTLKR